MKAPAATPSSTPDSQGSPACRNAADMIPVAITTVNRSRPAPGPGETGPAGGSRLDK